jgi:hypothetical protein
MASGAQTGPPPPPLLLLLVLVLVLLVLVLVLLLLLDATTHALTPQHPTILPLECQCRHPHYHHVITNPPLPKGGG